MERGAINKAIPLKDYRAAAVEAHPSTPYAPSHSNGGGGWGVWVGKVECELEREKKSRGEI